MKRRVRLTESQLRGIVEESSRRVIQEMIDEGWLGDTWNTMKSGFSDYWNGAKNIGKGAWNTLNSGLKTGFNLATAPGRAGMKFAADAMNGDISKGWNAAKNSFGQDLNDMRRNLNGMRQGFNTAANGALQSLKGTWKASPENAMLYAGINAMQNNKNPQQGFKRARR